MVKKTQLTILLIFAFLITVASVSGCKSKSQNQISAAEDENLELQHIDEYRRLIGKDGNSFEDNVAENDVSVDNENSFEAKEEKTTALRNGNKRKIEQPARMKGVPERLIEHTGYMLSFNRETNLANWVAWELTADETDGYVPRSKDFLPDPLVPAPHRVTTKDYARSGYDRGHQCPAADMKWSPAAMAECFYMSNICPQNRSLNSGAWATLEKACRRWANNEGKVYIACGPVFKSGKHKKIGRNVMVSVPDGFFKVVLSLAPGREKAIGFYYANRSGKQPMQQTAMSVDDVEAITGIDFFPNVPDKLENALEATYSLKKWQ